MGKKSILISIFLLIFCSQIAFTAVGDFYNKGNDTFYSLPDDVGLLIEDASDYQYSDDFYEEVEDKLFISVKDKEDARIEAVSDLLKDNDVSSNDIKEFITENYKMVSSAIDDSFEDLEKLSASEIGYNPPKKIKTGLLDSDLVDMMGEIPDEIETLESNEDYFYYIYILEDEDPVLIGDSYEHPYMEFYFHQETNGLVAWYGTYNYFSEHFSDYNSSNISKIKKGMNLVEVFEEVGYPLSNTMINKKELDKYLWYPDFTIYLDQDNKVESLKIQ